MRRDYSYGIIPVQVQEGLWQMLLIQHHTGHWAFPKGHADPGESPQQTAERELLEETGLTLERYLSFEPFIENYYFSHQGQRIHKTVAYYLALVKGNVTIQEREIQNSQWLNLVEGYQQMTFKEGKRICIQVTEFLKTLDNQGKSLISS